MNNTLASNQVALKDLYPGNRYEVKIGVKVERGKGWTYWGNLVHLWVSQGYSAVAFRLGAKRTW